MKNTQIAEAVEQEIYCINTAQLTGKAKEAIINPITFHFSPLKKHNNMKTLTGNIVEVRALKSYRAYLITVDGTTYRTGRMSSAEFEECAYNTANDWQYFLRTSGDYSVVPTRKLLAAK